MPTRVTGMVLDENSFVDVPANQLGRILLTKAAGPSGGTVPQTPDFETEEVDLDELQAGDIIVTDDGEQIELTEDMLDQINGLEPDDFVEEPQLEPVGKSFTDVVAEQLSKAFTEGSRDEVIKRVAGYVEQLEKRATRAEEIAKAERDTRLEADYTARAEQYGLPGVNPHELGPVMKRAAEVLPYEDCVILNKAFEIAGEAAATAFDEIGKSAGSNLDPFGVVSYVTEGKVDVSKAGDVEQYFLDNPEAYDEYEQARRGLG